MRKKWGEIYWGPLKFPNNIIPYFNAVFSWDEEMAIRGCVYCRKLERGGYVQPKELLGFRD